MKPCTALFAHTLNKMAIVETHSNYSVIKCPKCGFTETIRLRGVSMARKLDGMSPEEVLSGAQYGAQTSWGKPKSSKDWSQEHQEQVSYAKEVLA